MLLNFFFIHSSMLIMHFEITVICISSAPIELHSLENFFSSTGRALFLGRIKAVNPHRNVNTLFLVFSEATFFFPDLVGMSPFIRLKKIVLNLLARHCLLGLRVVNLVSKL